MSAAPIASAPACWCGAPSGAERSVALGRSGFRMLACAGCGTSRLAPSPDEATLAAAYARDYYGGGQQKFRGPVGPLFARAQGARARRVTRLVPRPGRLLDVGCGAGDFLRAMRAHGWTVEGTERTPESAARVADPAITVHVGDLLALALPAGAYDAVTFWHVLEHVRDPLATLERARTLLRPGGLVVLAVPNASSWQAKLFGGHWFHHDPPRHLWAFTRPALAALLGRAGLTPVATATLSIEQNPYGVVQSALNAAGFPRDRAYDVLKGVAGAGPGTRLVDLGLVAVLALPALAFSLAEAAAGRGGTLIVAARAECG